MEDLEKSKNLVFKLLVLLRFNVFAIQPDFLVQSIATALYSFIVGSLLQFLCIE